MLLVRHAPTAATGRAFAADEPISDPAVAAQTLAGRLPAEAEVLSSPKLRCRQTAQAAGRRPVVDLGLAECDFGRWEGRAFAELEADQTDGWLADPDASPHGGESLASFTARVTSWLEALDPAAAAPVIAFTHAGVIRAAVLHALGAPGTAWWRIGVAPLSVVELDRHDAGWVVAL